MTIFMPGTSHHGPLPPLGPDETRLRDALRRDVRTLAGEIGERNVHARPAALDAAVGFLEASLGQAGLPVQRQGYEVEGKTCFNLVVEVAGGALRDEVVVVGGHYDSVVGSPGANDNGTGTAAVLALARAFAAARPARTLRLVAFVNEEPPFFQTPLMGSWVYARQCRARGDDVKAMLSLETIGYYSDAPGSQHYPTPLSLIYPTTGSFVGFVGDLGSRALVQDLIGSFRRHTRFPSEAAALPAVVPGVGFSDHWAFWQEGYRAAMVTDTAMFRYPHYHTAEDTPDKVDYERLARVVAGLERVVAGLIEPRPDA